MQAATLFGMASTRQINETQQQAVGDAYAQIASEYRTVDYVGLFGTLQRSAGSTPPDATQPSPASLMADCTFPNATGFRALTDALVAAYWNAPRPQATPVVLPNPACVDQPVLFTSGSTTAADNEWRIDGVLTSTQASFMATFRSVGPRTVILWTANQAYTATATVSVPVNACPGIDGGLLDGGVLDASGSPDVGVDVGLSVDADVDAGPNADASLDAAVPPTDAAIDAGPTAPDATVDAGTIAPDAGLIAVDGGVQPIDVGFAPDAAVDAGAVIDDAGQDGGLDAGFDAEVVPDAQTADAAPDAQTADAAPDAQTADASDDAGATPPDAAVPDAEAPDAADNQPDAGPPVYDEVGIFGSGCSAAHHPARSDGHPLAWTIVIGVALIVRRRQTADRR